MRPFDMVHFLAEVGFSQQPESATMTPVYETAGWLGVRFSELSWAEPFCEQAFARFARPTVRYRAMDLSDPHSLIPSFGHGSTANQPTLSSFIWRQRQKLFAPNLSLAWVRQDSMDPPFGSFSKPLGHDLKSAIEINEAVLSVFKEQQVFRIDHYLGKQSVQNLMALRFGQLAF
jgi:glucose-6-phosphate 1-dehydrogenase